MKPTPFVVLLAPLALVACGQGGLTDLEEYVQKVMEREPAPIEPLPAVKQPDTFVFAPMSSRDPFMLDSQGVEASTRPRDDGIAPDPTRRKEELEQFPLDALAMVGTLEQGDTFWALIITPENALYHVRVGNYMGQNNGQITRITEEEIELAEIVSDGAGAWEERQAAISLSQ